MTDLRTYTEAYQYVDSKCVDIQTDIVGNGLNPNGHLDEMTLSQ